ncbi:MAG TPA: hypothetical protein VFS63_16130 [Pseudolabrys sp.]|jgi:hypothetical protein|nr:hypothetical protein [Pseudolabrys sp.]
MHFKAKNVAALQTLLEGWPDGMRVEADPGLGVSAKTVGELRKVLDWPDNLTITTPPDYSPGKIIRVSRANHSSRYAPKP